MLREKIEERITDLDLRQKDVAEYMGYTEQNLSAFLAGRHSLSYRKLICLLECVGLSSGPSDAVSGIVPPSEIRTSILTALRKKCKTKGEVAEEAGVDKTVFSSFMTGMRGISFSALDTIMTNLDLTLVSYGEPGIWKWQEEKERSI